MTDRRVVYGLKILVKYPLISADRGRALPLRDTISGMGFFSRDGYKTHRA